MTKSPSMPTFKTSDQTNDFIRSRRRRLMARLDRTITLDELIYLAQTLVTDDQMVEALEAKYREDANAADKA